LRQNVPNPFNPTTRITFTLATPGHTTLRIYDVKGRLVRTLIDGPLDATVHTATWDGLDRSGRRAATGVYFYEVVSGDFRSTRKMSLLK
jgi:flagellar hook assembly protein FlgD